MYSLEYGIMVQVLRQLGSSGEFQAEVPPHATLKYGGIAVIQVKSGNIISCIIFNKDGQQAYYDNEAQRTLPAFGILDWRLTSSMPTKLTRLEAPPATPAARGQRSAPQRLRVPEGQYSNWPALERSVYFLADGTHSIEQIAQILSRPVMIIERIIYNFEAKGIITR